MLVYDCEIEKAIPPRKDEARKRDVEYCEGWRDFKGMGITVITAYDSLENQFRVFLKDNLQIFQNLVNYHKSIGSPIAGFNSIAFDDKLCEANGLEVKTDYDLLVEEWKADGLGPTFSPATHGGYGLDATLKANGIAPKSGHGALAPIQWQQGEYGSVIDYCLGDTTKTWTVIKRVIDHGFIIHPKRTNEVLWVAKPLI